MMKSESSKRVKASNGGGIDRISNLPEPLLFHILSLLPTKCAVATSVLSTRWKFLWTSITNLDLCSYRPQHYRTVTLETKRETKRERRVKSIFFTHFVNRVLLLLNSPSIQNFRLECYQDCFDPSYLNLWFSAGLGRTVCQLELSLTLKEPFELPLSHIYSNVAVLKLVGGICFNIPATASVCFPSLQALHLDEVTSVIASNACVSFPNLKIMDLNCVKFANGDSVHKLFSSSPVLDELIIKKDIPDYVECLTIRIPSLTRLSIAFWTGDWIYKLHIDSPSLQYLNLDDGFPCEYLPSQNLSSLLEAKVKMDFGAWEYVNVEMCIDIIKFIGSLSKVKFISLSSDVIKAFGTASVNLSPDFHNLTRLEVTVDDCLGFSVIINKFLGSMYNLEHLVMEGSRYEYCSHQPWWSEPQNVPNCLLSRITTVSCTYMIDDCCDQLEMLRYFLKNAEVLTSMTICIAHLPAKEQFELLKKVSKIPRGSRTCQVEFT